MTLLLADAAAGRRSQAACWCSLSLMMRSTATCTQKLFISHLEDAPAAEAGGLLRDGCDVM